MRKVINRTKWTVLWPILLAFGLFAQTPPAFEVASVKPGTPENASSIRIGIQGGPGTSDPEHFTVENLSLKRLLSQAYGLKSYQISGPSWLDNDRFTIVAKVPAGATKEDASSMLRNLLLDRFKLTVHREQRDLPVLAMVLAKGGPKFKESDTAEGAGNGGSGAAGSRASTPPAPAAARTGMAAGANSADGAGASANSGHSRMIAKKRTMSWLADILTIRMDRPVVDMTALHGQYDFSLDYTREPGPGVDVATADIFSAMQEQLGLKLEARKSTLDVLVVDQALRVPIDN